MNKAGIVSTKIKDKNLMLHRLIMNYNGDLCIDHINHNPRDNRKENLRIANKSQNGQNRKSSKGYYFKKDVGRYSANIVVEGKSIHLGYYNTKEEAHSVYQEARIKYFKEFAPKEENYSVN